MASTSTDLAAPSPDATEPRMVLLRRLVGGAALQSNQSLHPKAGLQYFKSTPAQASPGPRTADCGLWGLRAPLAWLTHGGEPGSCSRAASIGSLAIDGVLAEDLLHKAPWCAQLRCYVCLGLVEHSGKNDPDIFTATK